MSTVDPILVNCEFANWYKLFKKLTPRTRVLEAPEEFREYLLADGIKLREEEDSSSSDSEWESLDVPEKGSARSAAEARVGFDPESDSDSDSEDATLLSEPPADFHDIIEQTIANLNGAVAPKLNWSAPVDSKWMLTDNSMQCKRPNDIYMLLKSSDYVNHDLQLKPAKLTLVLREWFDLHPSTEFRCFVRDRVLVGISQRDMNYYEFLEDAKPDILRLSAELNAAISEKYPDPSFIFDLHIPLNGSRKPSRAWLIDINPWHEQTDSLLYTWDELPALKEPEVRLVEKADRSRTFSSKPHSASQVPYDFVDMPRSTLEDMLKQMKDQQSRESNGNDHRNGSAASAS